MIRINVISTVAKCCICLLLFLFCACKEKPKESTPPQTVQPDTSSARGGYENMEAPRSGEESVQFNMYPNPAHNDFSIELNELADGMEYFIASGNGPIVLQGDITSQKEKIDISGLESGIYYVKVSSKEKKPTLKRLVVQD